jgi:hypothetical protein
LESYRVNAPDLSTKYIELNKRIMELTTEVEVLSTILRAGHKER